MTWSWPQLLAALQAQAPRGVTLTQVSGTVGTAVGAGTTNTAPTAALPAAGVTAVGSMTVVGTAPDKSTVANYTDVLSRSKGLATASVNSVDGRYAGRRVQPDGAHHHGGPPAAAGPRRPAPPPEATDMSALAHTSNRQRLWLVGGAFVALLLMLIGYFALIGPQRSETDAVNSRVDATRTQNSVLASRITALQVQNRQLSTYRGAGPRGHGRAARHQRRPGVPAQPAGPGLTNPHGRGQCHGRRTARRHHRRQRHGGHTRHGPAPRPHPLRRPARRPPRRPASTACRSPRRSTVRRRALAQFLQQLQDVQPRAVLITSITQGTANRGHQRHHRCERAPPCS